MGESAVLGAGYLVQGIEITTTSEQLRLLAEALDEDNQASLALVLYCAAEGRLDLAEQAAAVALAVHRDGERTAVADEVYARVVKELRTHKERKLGTQPMRVEWS